jgi:DMSO/TMAO reductase YedYZ heme-binding membrane subunit
MSLFTIYLLLGLIFMIVMIMYIATSNKMPRRYYRWCLVFPVHAFVVVFCCITFAAVVHYIENKKRLGGK